MTAFDVGSDWTLEITENPWSDPFANASPDHLRDLEDEVGVWVRTVNAEEPLATLIGQTLLSATPARNDQGDLVGARLNFDTTTLRVSAHGGNLLALVE